MLVGGHILRLQVGLEDDRQHLEHLPQRKVSNCFETFRKAQITQEKTTVLGNRKVTGINQQTFYGQVYQLCLLHDIDACSILFKG